MPAPIHRSLVDAIEADLLVVPAVASGNLQRQRGRPLALGVDQQVSLRLVSSRGQAAMLGGTTPIEWQTVVAVECTARAAIGAMPDEAVADLLATVHARITGSTALPAAGYLLVDEHALQWDDDTLDERIGNVSALYTFRHFGGLSTVSA